MIAHAVTRALDLLDRVIDAFAATALLLVTAVVFLNAVGRYFLNFALIGAEEFARLLTVYLCFLGAYALLRRDGHVSVDVVMVLAPPWLQRVLRGLVGVVGLLVMVFLAWASWRLVAFSAGTGQRSTTLPVPRYLFFLPLAVGASLMAVASAETVLRAVTNTLRPLPKLAEVDAPKPTGPAGAGAAVPPPGRE